jgi:5-methylcytosine-specific restriction endonuclease McrA
MENLRRWRAAWRIKNLDRLRAQAREESRRRREADPEHRRAIVNASYARRSEQRLAYRMAHREQARRHSKAWKARQTPEKLRLLRLVHNANLAAKRLGIAGRIHLVDVASLPLACVYCGAGEHLTLEHATPMSRGGENHWSNLTIACFPCNRDKCAKTVVEYLESRRAG